MAYELRQYATAIELLEQEYDKSSDGFQGGQKAYLIAESFVHIDQPEQAIPWYRKAIERDYGTRAMLGYAQALKNTGRYQESIAVYNMLKTEIDLDILLDQQIKANQYALELERNVDTTVFIENMSFNSEYSEYSPFLMRNKMLLFTSDRFAPQNDEVYSWTGNGFSDIYRCYLDSKEASLWDEGFNTKANEGNVWLNKNLSEMYFTLCETAGSSDAYCDIYFSRREPNADWSKPIRLNFAGESQNCKHPVLSENGQLIVFACDGTNQGYDLYFSTRQEDNTWGIKNNIGRPINTEGDEMFPFLHRDTLYFSSNGHPGLGGHDIFYTYYDSEDRWITPINLGSPFNSYSDDISFIIDTFDHAEETEIKGFFASSRPGGMGGDDIYGFKKFRKAKKKREESGEYVLILKVLEPVHQEKNDPNSPIVKYRPLKNVKVTFLEDQQLTGIEGKVVSRLDEAATFSIMLERTGYLTKSTTVDSLQFMNEGQTAIVKVVLDKIYYNQEIVLNSIFYDFEKWNIRDDARPALDSLARILITNPNLTISLSSHTDCRGDLQFNQELSQKRAQSAVDYLINKGIQPKRLRADGFGETVPEVDCICDQCTEKEHQRNRRTAFTILK